MIHILRGMSRDTAHRHDSVAEARLCQDQADHDEAQAAAEIAAESAWLRVAESGTYAGSLEDARDRYLDSLAGR